MKKGEGITRLKKWRVIHARAYKSMSASEHEYVSVAVVDPQDKISYVAIERRRSDPDPIPSSNTNIDPQPLGPFSSSNSSLSSVSLVPDSISPNRLADDRISPLPSSGMWDVSDKLICELRFDKPLYLYELAILALIVHEVNTSNLLITNNCYIFAGTIMRMLVEVYDPMDTAGGANAGEWCGVVISSSTEGNISFLLEKFKECIKKFVSFIPILSNLPQALLTLLWV